MTANELADALEQRNVNYTYDGFYNKQAATMLRQQAQEIEDLKNANRFIQNFAEEQHQKALALETEIEALKKELALQRLSDIGQEIERELTDEEIKQIFQEQTGFFFDDNPADGLALMDFARAILKKASEK